MLLKKLQKLKINKIATAIALTTLATAAQAGFKVQIDDQSSIEFGGYIKADARYVDGNVAYRDFWIGTGTALPEDSKQIKLFANETRFNTKYTHGDVMGFIELDFYGGGGNEIISNSANPRIRHAFIKYKDILVGQTWSTFMNPGAIPESADFAGPAVGIVFIRQGQLRYTNGGLQLAIENPESFGGKPTNDDFPDLIARYNMKGDWGNVSFSGLARSLSTATGQSESTFGVSIAGKIKTVGKDDFRFQLHKGELGRYVSVVGATDLVGEKVEDTTSYMVAYRHFWTGDLRSTAFYGYVETDESNQERSHWGVNVFKSVTPSLSFGVELGNFSIDEQNADSNYFQFSAKYAL